MKDFNQLLSNSLTKAQYDNLAEYLGVTPNTMTRLEKDPSRFETQQIKKLSKLMKVAPEILVFEYKLGFSVLSGEELAQIAAEAGYNISLTATAA